MAEKFKFSVEKLRDTVSKYQTRKYDVERRCSAQIGDAELRDTKVLDAPDFEFFDLENPLPDFRRHARCDPLDIGNTDKDVFDANGELKRKKIYLRNDIDGYRTVDIACRLALALPFPCPQLSVFNPIQLHRKMLAARLQFISKLHGKRAMLLRKHDCEIFRTVDTYRRHLLCAPPESLLVQHLATRRFCRITRYCPYCWLNAYVTRPFFGFRALLIDHCRDGKPCVRSDRKLISVAQCWTRPASTHPYRLLRELQVRRDELYRETPKARKCVKGMMQLQYVEPPLEREAPWRLHRRALMVCDITQPTFGYPQNGYDVRNDSYLNYPPTIRMLAQIVARTAAYPAAFLLAPLDRTRQLLNGQVRWPHDRKNGFQIFSTRGCLQRASNILRYGEDESDTHDQDWEIAQTARDE